VELSFILIMVILLVALALFFDFTNGFHDAANAVSTVVATRALPAKWAPAFSAFFNTIAYFFIGTAVANTISKIVDSKLLMHDQHVGLAIIFAALFAAIVWNFLTWRFGMPSSSSHALVGGLVGAGLAAGGAHAVNWEATSKAAMGIIASPMVAFIAAFIGMIIVFGVQRVWNQHDNSEPFKKLQLIAAAALSFGHGANDAQKTMGVIAALLLATGYTQMDGKLIPVPEWVAMSAYLAIGLGTLWGGWKIIETMGLRITTLHANSGLAANIGASIAIFGATSIGMPISTTHAAASSIVGAGIASGAGARWKVVGEMAVAWIITIPASATVAFICYQLTILPGQLSWIAITALVLGFGSWVAYAMTHTIGAHDIEEELPTEEQLAVDTDHRPHLTGHAPIENEPWEPGLPEHKM
jgi:PiT family inorganic phosphate transporter